MMSSVPIIEITEISLIRNMPVTSSSIAVIDQNKRSVNLALANANVSVHPTVAEEHHTLNGNPHPPPMAAHWKRHTEKKKLSLNQRF